MTLDGQTATSTGDSQWISNEQSRQYVHQMRDRSDAIMVGIGTILADDPSLTTRLPEGGKDPVRIIVDSKLRIPESARVVCQESSARSIIITTNQADEAKIVSIQSKGVEVIVVSDRDGRVDLSQAMEKLGALNIQSILLEGGANLAASALKEGIVDRVAVFIAPKLLGGNDGSSVLLGPGCSSLEDALHLKDIRVRHFADDILVEGEIR